MSQSEPVMHNEPSDTELVEMLSARDRDKVNVAIEKIVVRGEK